jgi:hypothetical protein
VRFWVSRRGRARPLSQAGVAEIDGSDEELGHVDDLEALLGLAGCLLGVHRVAEHDHAVGAGRGGYSSWILSHRGGAGWAASEAPRVMDGKVDGNKRARLARQPVCVPCAWS